MKAGFHGRPDYVPEQKPRSADSSWNPYAGYNTSLFAYGQTGAGKSYSMVGYGINKEGLQFTVR